MKSVRSCVSTPSPMAIDRQSIGYRSRGEAWWEHGTTADRPPDPAMKIDQPARNRGSREVPRLVRRKRRKHVVDQAAQGSFGEFARHGAEVDLPENFVDVDNLDQRPDLIGHGLGISDDGRPQFP